jgi:hypothetical protein
MLLDYTRQQLPGGPVHPMRAVRPDVWCGHTGIHPGCWGTAENRQGAV